jgi:hypothetical protein
LGGADRPTVASRAPSAPTISPRTNLLGSGGNASGRGTSFPVHPVHPVIPIIYIYTRRDLGGALCGAGLSVCLCLFNLVGALGALGSPLISLMNSRKLLGAPFSGVGALGARPSRRFPIPPDRAQNGISGRGAGGSCDGSCPLSRSICVGWETFGSVMPKNCCASRWKNPTDMPLPPGCSCTRTFFAAPWVADTIHFASFRRRPSVPTHSFGTRGDVFFQRLPAACILL